MVMRMDTIRLVGIAPGLSQRTPLECTFDFRWLWTSLRHFAFITPDTENGNLDLPEKYQQLEGMKHNERMVLAIFDLLVEMPT